MSDAATESFPTALFALPAVLMGVIENVVDATRAKIIDLAHERLSSAEQTYTAGVQEPQFYTRGRLPRPDELVASIALFGWLPNAVEQGWGGGDMKAYLLAGRKAKVAADGTRYNTVPFRHGTPGTTGRNMPTMGSAYQDRRVANRGGGFDRVGSMGIREAEVLGRRVHVAARLLPATQQIGDFVVRGGRLEAGLAPILRAHHRTDIYAGMIRERHGEGAGASNQYTTFRRVSESSDPAAWVHPGIEAHHLFRVAAPYVHKAMSMFVDQAMQGLTRAERGSL